LHIEAKQRLEALSEYIRSTSVKLEKTVRDDDLDGLRSMMDLFKQVRERESGIDMEIAPIMEMYHMLEHNLPSGFMEKSEIDKKTVLRSAWRKLVATAAKRAEELSVKQHVHKKRLKKDRMLLKKEVAKLREDWLTSGPGVPGVEPEKALDRLRFSKDKLAQCQRKHGTGVATKTSNLSSSVESTSIRLIFGRIDGPRRVLEARQKRSRRNGRLRTR
jgi:dynein heavy chain